MVDLLGTFNNIPHSPVYIMVVSGEFKYRDLGKVTSSSMAEECVLCIKVNSSLHNTIFYNFIFQVSLLHNFGKQYKNIWCMITSVQYIVQYCKM